MVEPKIVSDAPSDVVVGAGSVTADSNSANDYLTRTIQRQSSAENVDTTNLVTHHRILGGADLPGRPVIGFLRLDRVAVLQTVEAASWLHGGIQIRSRQRQPVGLS